MLPDKSENSESNEQLKRDAELSLFLKRMPETVRDSFSHKQLSSMKSAINSQNRGNHTIDIRHTIKFFHYHYYYVFIAGRDLRELTRREKHISLLMKTAFTTIFLSLCALLGILVLYLIKSAMGINIFPNYSFGVWDWFKGVFLHS
ncbi:hypothetical protein [Psychromonas ossibalaenae]|uniref:hypothetical protein n=1 Tax=Psychromonas ossibalaenae TaxID=444922 RepID=UPI000369EC10|nr:hypothetical protein [Psychromonas ossibalaenae]